VKINEWAWSLNPLPHLPGFHMQPSRSGRQRFAVQGDFFLNFRHFIGVVFPFLTSEMAGNTVTGVTLANNFYSAGGPLAHRGIPCEDSEHAQSAYSEKGGGEGESAFSIRSRSDKV
jgi:hypothetical protein